MKSTQKFKTDQKEILTFTTTVLTTFSLDYHSKNDFQPIMMIIVEAGNRNPNVKNMSCSKIKTKTIFGMQRRLM